MRAPLVILALATTVCLGQETAARSSQAQDLYSCVSKVFSTTASQRIVRPEDDTYLDARLGEKIQFTEFPLLIAYAEKAEEVGKLVKCAKKAGVKAVPRTGGHSFTAFSSLNGTLVIDIAHINQVQVSRDRRSATVGAGIRLGALYTALNEYDTSFIGGICPTVGLAGFLGSGGFNMQQRSQGLGVDHVLAAKVVTADGRTVLASPKSHPDLFWAIRGGGGGTYGIVVEFTLSLTKVPRSAMLLLSWNNTEARFPVARRFLDWAPNQEPAFMSQINVYHDTVQVVAMHYGRSAQALRSIVNASGLLDIGHPEVVIAGGCNVDNARIFGYTAMDCLPDDQVDASILNVIPDPFSQVGNHPQFQYKEERKSDTVGPAAPWDRFYRLSKSFFVQKNRPLSDEVLRGVVDRIGQLDEASEIWGEWHSWNIPRKTLGSKNAFPWREQAYAHLEFQIHGSENQTQQQAYENWFEDLESFLRPAVGPASYSGYMDADISADPLVSYYGDNVCRLISIKQKYDPEEFFTNPFSIPASVPEGIEC
ncbi:FAD-binding domain-containing protein [Aspergillus steynii IBT 23096]|uniref:FAD-binding domain-containing protein n=1 Tax=Aspergillus steynii IBT 23096 TaxID=1392250 RepID=A0A2I2GAG1_9EURO|nr:FAD-binding domain-containing protein [Aspergillus steynii IBT 23096]PLB49864.1 FAD-binding domain-containing protein [Aspergillus steynii IBT 23096]